MNRKELMSHVAAILVTLNEMETGTPESILYIAMNMDMAKYNVVIDFLLVAELVTVKNHFVEITEKGKGIALALA
jgi:predicted transcriptional regulator